MHAKGINLLKTGVEIQVKFQVLLYFSCSPHIATSPSLEVYVIPPPKVSCGARSVDVPHL